jgi:5-formyltetrahydrofolate cyclo-ligase
VRGDDAGLAPLGPADFPILIILPGLAFDREGNRLGRGKGFYDRFLASLESNGTRGARQRRYRSVGLCMETQIVPRLPVTPRDIPMNALYTGSAFHSAGNSVSMGPKTP